MPRIAALLLAALLLTDACAASRPQRHRPTRQPEAASEQGLAAMEDAIFGATNRFRADHGLPSLAHDPALRRFAGSRSRDMAERHYFSHTEPGGKGVFQLMDAAGIAYRFAAENIHMSRGVGPAKVAETAMHGWINSPGHRANMLAKQPTHIGVGVAQAANGAYYSTQVFTKP